MKIYLIRHGQTTGDVEDRYGGDYDDELTAIGKTQAEDLAKKLKETDFEILFASPKIRAQQTAKILSSVLGGKYETLEYLRERNKNGVLTGLTKEEANEKYPDLVEAAKDYRNLIDGGESFEDFKLRVINVWSQIINTNYSTIAVVTHGGVIITLLSDVLKVGLADVSDCGYAIINGDNGKFTVGKMDGIEVKKS